MDEKRAGEFIAQARKRFEVDLSVSASPGSSCSVLSTALEAEEIELRGLWDEPELKLNKVCPASQLIQASPVQSAKTGRGFACLDTDVG